MLWGKPYDNYRISHYLYYFRERVNLFICKMNIQVEAMHVTEVRFDNFLSGGSTTMAVINPPERKLAKRTSLQCDDFILSF